MLHDPLNPAASGVGGSPEAQLTRRQIRERERLAELAAVAAGEAADAPIAAVSDPASGLFAAVDAELDAARVDDVATSVPAFDEIFLSAEPDDGVAIVPTAAIAEPPAEVITSSALSTRDRAALRLDLGSDDLPPVAPASRREARAGRAVDDQPRAGRRSAHSDAKTGRADVPTTTIPIVAPAPAVKAAAAAPRKKSRHLATKGMAGLVMAMVALIAVATSTPANALLSAQDVQDAADLVTTSDVATGPEQTVSVSDAVGQYQVQRDGYDTATIAQVAAESGIRMEATFTNDPNGTVQWPFRVGVHIGDRFGYRNCAGCSADHHGQDFNPGLGAPIQAIADGVVTKAEDGEGDLGVNMMIQHVINGKTITSVYAHMQHGSMKFAVGDTVKVGDVIGNVGNTGMSTGPHLHFEIRLGGIDGAWTDPLAWLYANTN